MRPVEGVMVGDLYGWLDGCVEGNAMVYSAKQGCVAGCTWRKFAWGVTGYVIRTGHEGFLGEF